MGVRSIAIINEKGGVGKTTISSLGAEYLAIVRQKRVLLIDFDGQLNLTEQWVGVDHDEDGRVVPPKHPDYDPNDELHRSMFRERSAITDIFFNLGVLPHGTFIGNGDPDSPRVDIMCGNKRHMDTLLRTFGHMQGEAFLQEDERVGISEDRMVELLRRFVFSDQIAALYDYVLIDSGPTMSPLLRGTIRASTHVITPYQPDGFSAMGISTIIGAINTANSYCDGDEPIDFVGVFPNMFDARNDNQYKTIQEALARFRDYHFPKGLWLKRRKGISDRVSKQRRRPESIFYLPPSREEVQEALRVFDYIYERTGG